MNGISRREVLRAGAAVTATAMTSRLWSVPRAWANDNGVSPRNVWEPVGSYALPHVDSIHPTLIPAQQFTPSTAFDRWHLYVWTHGPEDSIADTHFDLFSAPDPAGPYTWQKEMLNGCKELGVPTGYKDYHLSSGDVVWDPIGNRYISSPHGKRWSGEQDSFLIQSTDGFTWQWIDNPLLSSVKPQLPCGPLGTADDIHTGYGRLLRDLDGNLRQANGQYQWIYRAQRKDGTTVGTPAGSETVAPTLYRPWLASSGSLSGGWSKLPQQAFVGLPTPDASVVGMGSFLVAVSKYWVQYASGVSLAAEPTSHYLLGGAATLDPGLLTAEQVPIAFSPETSSPVPDTAVVFPTAGGANIIRDPWDSTNHYQYAVTVSFGNVIVDSLTGVPVAEIPAYANIYRAAVAQPNP